MGGLIERLNGPFLCTREGFKGERVGQFYFDREEDATSSLTGAILCTYVKLSASQFGGVGLSQLRSFTLRSATASQIQLLGAKTLGSTPTLEFVELAA